MRAICLALLANGVRGARVALHDDLQRDSAKKDPLADVELPPPLSARERTKDRTSFKFLRHMLAMSGAPYDETFCHYSRDGCVTTDEYPGRNTHSELTFDRVVEELQEVPEREVTGQIRRLGDLGYLIFNEKLWHNDWKTFPIGADLADHRMGRPIADALMGHDSAAWSREFIRQEAEKFFQGRESLSPTDMDNWNAKVLHKILLNWDVTDEELEFFQSYKGKQTIVSTLPKWLVSVARWALGLRQAREARETLLEKMMEKMDQDPRGLYVVPENPRSKRFTADLLLTALTSAGGLSVPTLMGMAMGVLHGATSHGQGPFLPADFTLTNQNLEQFVLEAVRRFPTVVGFPWWSGKENDFRSVLNLAMAARDPRVWESPKEFILRPLSEYHKKAGTGTKIGVSWAQQGIGKNGLTPDSRGCPGQQLSVVLAEEFFRAYMPHQHEWTVGTMPKGGIQITEGPCAVNGYVLVRNGHAPESPAAPAMVTPAPKDAAEAEAEAIATWR